MRFVWFRLFLEKYLKTISEVSGTPVEQLKTLPYDEIMKLVEKLGLVYDSHTGHMKTGFTEEKVKTDNKRYRGGMEDFFGEDIILMADAF